MWSLQHTALSLFLFLPPLPPPASECDLPELFIIFFYLIASACSCYFTSGFFVALVHYDLSYPSCHAACDKFLLLSFFCSVGLVIQYF